MTKLQNRSVNRATLALIAVSFAGALGAAAPAAATPNYDGLWSVSIVTEKGDCDRGYRYPIRISNGQVVNAGDTTFTISGKIAPTTGTITVTVAAAGKSATGSGRLAGDMGGGHWTGGACSGSWTAERRGA